MKERQQTDQLCTNLTACKAIGEMAQKSNKADAVSHMPLIACSGS
jgi:hypothetical protein